MTPEQGAMVAMAEAYYLGLKLQGVLPPAALPCVHYTQFLGGTDADEVPGAIWVFLESLN